MLSYHIFRYGDIPDLKIIIDTYIDNKIQYNLYTYISNLIYVYKDGICCHGEIKKVNSIEIHDIRILIDKIKASDPDIWILNNLVLKIIKNYYNKNPTGNYYIINDSLKEWCDRWQQIYNSNTT